MYGMADYIRTGYFKEEVLRNATLLSVKNAMNYRRVDANTL